MTQKQISKQTLYDAIQDRELTIRCLNDAFRRSFTYNELHVSSDMQRLSPVDQENILEAIRSYRNFTQFNDVNRQHNSGRFQYNGLDVVWEIYCVDRDLKQESVDPANITHTIRYMMVCFIHESWNDLPLTKN